MTTDDGIGAMAEAISEEVDPEGIPEQTSSEKWPAALATLITARIAIIAAESEVALTIALKKAIFGVIGGLCLLLTYLMVLAGAIGGIPKICGLEWYHVSFIIAIIHLLIAIVGVIGIRQKSAPLFTFTKSEFKKDKQWLTTVKIQSTSKN